LNMRPDSRPTAPGAPAAGSQPSGQPPAAPSRSRVIRRRVWTFGRLLILLLALGITYGAFFITALRVTTKAHEVKVPDLKGKGVADADNIVKRLGLVLKLDPTPVPDPAMPANHVLSQDPMPGTTLRRGRAVKIRVSEGLRAALVPSVGGQPERTAELALDGAHLQVLGRAEIKSSDYPGGTIVAQDPPPGARASGVRLLINRPEDGTTYVVPDLVGLPYGKVVQALRPFPFRIGNGGDMVNPNLPTGTIVQQFPQAGSQIRAQDQLTLWTSK
jgi:eukaryotic-like serine/threonine-protein kinase